MIGLVVLTCNTENVGILGQCNLISDEIQLHFDNLGKSIEKGLVTQKNHTQVLCIFSQISGMLSMFNIFNKYVLFLVFFKPRSK